MVKLGRLQSIPIFSALTKQELRRIADCADEITVVAGEELVRETEWAFEFFAISKGTAEVVRDGARVADLQPGDVVGELAALSHGRRTASVIATTPGRVIYIRAQDFRHFTEEMPALGEQIRRVVNERTRSLDSAGV